MPWRIKGQLGTYRLALRSGAVSFVGRAPQPAAAQSPAAQRLWAVEPFEIRRAPIANYLDAHSSTKRPGAVRAASRGERAGRSAKGLRQRYGLAEWAGQTETGVESRAKGSSVSSRHSRRATAPRAGASCSGQAGDHLGPCRPSSSIKITDQGRPGLACLERTSVLAGVPRGSWHPMATGWLAGLKPWPRNAAGSGARHPQEHKQHRLGKVVPSAGPKLSRKPVRTTAGSPYPVWAAAYRHFFVVGMHRFGALPLTQGSPLPTASLNLPASRGDRAAVAGLPGSRYQGRTLIDQPVMSESRRRRPVIRSRRRLGVINPAPRRSAAGRAGGGSQSAQQPPGPGPQGRAVQSLPLPRPACDPSGSCPGVLQAEPAMLVCTAIPPRPGLLLGQAGDVSNRVVLTGSGASFTSSADRPATGASRSTSRRS